MFVELEYKNLVLLKSRRNEVWNTLFNSPQHQQAQAFSDKLQVFSPKELRDAPSTLGDAFTTIALLAMGS